MPPPKRFNSRGKLDHFCLITKASGYRKIPYWFPILQTAFYSKRAIWQTGDSLKQNKVKALSIDHSLLRQRELEEQTVSKYLIRSKKNLAKHFLEPSNSRKIRSLVTTKPLRIKYCRNIPGKLYYISTTKVAPNLT